MQGDLQGIGQVVDVGRRDIGVGGGVLLRVQHDMHLQPLGNARAGRLRPVVEARAAQGDRSRIDQADHLPAGLALLAADTFEQFLAEQAERL
ncbi:hypothetical protein D3C78_1358800 [compost metagenome]